MTDTTAGSGAAADAQDAVQGTSEGAEGQEQTREQIAELVAKLTEESNDLKDRLLRTLAEMENLRRRTEREVADARTYGVTNFARELLGVADNLARALQLADTRMREAADEPTRSLIEGVELTERELIKALDKNGVKKFDPQGEKFDPNLHQAMFELPDPSVPSGMVAQVVQPGYRIGERVLRPAMVGVSKGGPKVAPGGN
ncbi:MAG TPA: nucleotide exchange factor GrpE [Xanthobacteraceae bacterium]|nr:nucleotide exchange factor GrpE [Xanthobacteraceae bacterium]